jgi:hypothetical protein
MVFSLNFKFYFLKKLKIKIEKSIREELDEIRDEHQRNFE